MNHRMMYRLPQAHHVRLSLDSQEVFLTKKALISDQEIYLLPRDPGFSISGRAHFWKTQETIYVEISDAHH